MITINHTTLSKVKYDDINPGQYFVWGDDCDDFGIVPYVCIKVNKQQYVDFDPREGQAAIIQVPDINGQSICYLLHTNVHFTECHIK